MEIRGLRVLQEEEADNAKAAGCVCQACSRESKQIRTAVAEGTEHGGRALGG